MPVMVRQHFISSSFHILTGRVWESLFSVMKSPKAPNDNYLHLRARHSEAAQAAHSGSCFRGCGWLIAPATSNLPSVASSPPQNSSLHQSATVHWLTARGSFPGGMPRDRQNLLQEEGCPTNCFWSNQATMTITAKGTGSGRGIQIQQCQILLPKQPVLVSKNGVDTVLSNPHAGSAPCMCHSHCRYKIRPGCAME